MLLVSDTAHDTRDVYPGPRRSAIDALDYVILAHEQVMNQALDLHDYLSASAAQLLLKDCREKREALFTCSIHEIDGVYDFDTGRGE